MKLSPIFTSIIPFSSCFLPKNCCCSWNDAFPVPCTLYNLHTIRNEQTFAEVLEFFIFTELFLGVPSTHSVHGWDERTAWDYRPKRKQNWSYECKIYSIIFLL